jgi:thiamine pyrophosphate-dependent acetolactate synthase large subunit-like protein
MTQAVDSPRQALLARMRARQSVPGHRVVAESLRRLGVTHVYGVGGVPVNSTLGACASVGIRVIGARHQQGAVLMSLGHNYVAGGLRSAVVVSAGPAVTNCSTGILVGRDNRWPLLVIGGRRSPLLRGGFQDFDGAAFFAPITKTSAALSATPDIASAIERATAAATTAPYGPVYLDVTEDALAAQWTHVAPEATLKPPAPSNVESSFSVDATSLRRAVTLLASARRRAMLIGDGARWSMPVAELRRLAEDFSIPFACAPMGRGLLPDDHPLCFSAARPRMLGDADAVIVIGARLDWTFRFGNEIAPGAQIIHLDVDPAVAADVLGRGVALCGDARQTLLALIAELDGERAAGRCAPTDSTWLEAVAADVAAARRGAIPDGQYGLQPMSPFEWLAEGARVVPPEAITVLDGNVVMGAAQRLLPVSRPVTRLTPGSNGCMGVGVPFAIGAKLARPELPVVAIVGDFALGLTAMELETAVRHRVPIVVLTANNAGAGGALRQAAEFPTDYPERVLRFTPDARYDLVMAALGGRGVHVTRPGQLGPVLAAALTSNEPVCIDVATNESTPWTPVV